MKTYIESQMYWIGLYKTKEKAKEVKNTLNKLIKNPNIKAHVEFARNFNNMNYDYGVILKVGE